MLYSRNLWRPSGTQFLVAVAVPVAAVEVAAFGEPAPYRVFAGLVVRMFEIANQTSILVAYIN
jgi:hypothetical protein